MDHDGHYAELIRQMKVIKDRVRGVVRGKYNGLYLYRRAGTPKSEEDRAMAATDGKESSGLLPTIDRTEKGWSGARLTLAPIQRLAPPDLPPNRQTNPFSMQSDEYGWDNFNLLSEKAGLAHYFISGTQPRKSTSIHNLGRSLDELLRGRCCWRALFHQQHLCFNRAGRTMSKIYVHETFDHRKVLPPRLWPYHEDAKYLLHLVYQHGLLHHGAVARKDRSANLKYDYLTKVIDGRHFRQIRQVLEDSDWLRCDHEYIGNQKSFSYSLGSKANKGQFRQVDLTKKKLIQKIEDWKAEREVALTDTTRHITSLLPQISLDEDDANALVQQGALGSRQALVEQFMFIRNGCWFATCCEAGRFYTNITSLRTDGRNALRVNNKRLYNIDVSDSQFLALVLLVENFLNGRPLDYIQYYSESPVIDDALLAVDPFTVVPHFPENEACCPNAQECPVILHIKEKGEGKRRECLTASMKCPKTPIRPTQTRENTLMSLRDPEWTLFRELVQTGELKDYVSTKLRKSRKGTKKVLMQWVFGQSHREAKVAKHMERVFPKLFQFIRQIKEGRKGNKLLAFLLTRIESKLIIDTAARRISQERPNMFFTTIHDSIMVEPDHVDYVKPLLTDVYRHQGLDVHLKVEAEFRRK